jgi:hypothetical protein
MTTVKPKHNRRRFTAGALITGVIGAALLTVSMTGTLSGFVASITNSTNTAATGTLVMEEKTTGGTPVTCLSTDGGSVSTNAATCSTINKFGGSTTMVPGGPASVTSLTIKNTGTVSASTFTLVPGATCAQSSNGTVNGSALDLCSKLNVVITSGASTVFSGTAATLAGATTAITMPAAPASGVSVPFTISVQLAATAGNTYQGLSASLPLTWSFAS